MTKRRYTYKLRTFINASHAVNWHNVQGAEHPHTWELILDIRPKDVLEDVKFEDMEAVIAATVNPFSGHFLNEISPFDTVTPTLENFSKLLFDILSAALDEISCRLLELSVGESPTRFYSVIRDED